MIPPTSAATSTTTWTASGPPSGSPRRRWPGWRRIRSARGSFPNSGKATCWPRWGLGCGNSRRPEAARCRCRMHRRHSAAVDCPRLDLSHNSGLPNERSVIRGWSPSMTETDIASATTGTAPRHAVLANDNTAEWLGIEVQHVGDGEATITMTLRPEMLNGFGIGHGGMIFALGDTAFAMACNTPDGAQEIVAEFRGRSRTIPKR